MIGTKGLTEIEVSFSIVVNTSHGILKMCKSGVVHGGSVAVVTKPKPIGCSLFPAS